MASETATDDYDARARAPLLTTATTGSSHERSHAYSPVKSSSATTRTHRLQYQGPEFVPIALTAYEPGKRYRPRRRDTREYSSDSGTSRTGRTPTDDETSDTDDSPSPRKPPLSPAPPTAASHVNLYLIGGILAVLLVGAAAFLWRSHSALSESNKSLLAAESSQDATPVRDARENPADTTIQSKPDSSPSASTPNEDATLESSKTPHPKSASASRTLAPSPSSAGNKSPSSSDSGDHGADDDDVESAPPSEYSGITLAGTFVDTASYAVATGQAGYVGDDKANADMSKISVEPNRELVEDRQGKIWVGDVTFYAAGKGGYGSCGTKLYDGQELYFAAMSTYDLMGSASPSPFCYSCISLQNVKDPTKTITAVVADSCPACTLAHVDLEQAAFFALGATVEMGVLTVAWSFVDCPDGWSKEELEKTSPSVYDEVES